MSISSISSYGSGLSLVDFLTNNTDSEDSSDDSTGLLNSVGASISPAGNKLSSKAGAAYGASMVSGAGQAAVKRALSEITPNSSGNITFQMIKDHRAELEKDLTEALKAGLSLEGVDPKAEFSLVATKDGKIQVNCDDPNTKDKIEKFLGDHPKVASQFLYVQALGNLERAQASPESTRNWTEMRNTKAELQAQSIAAFFAASEEAGNGFASLLGQFGDGSSSFSLGANYTV